MKAKIPFLTAVCLAACALGVSPALAKEKKSPAPDPSASPTASAAATEKKARPVPYRGKVGSVDSDAHTFTVGKRTIKVTDETKITRQKAAATMADIVADEPVRGSYWKKEDGTLEAKSVKLGAKNGKGQKKESKTVEEAAPSVSPKP